MNPAKKARNSILASVGVKNRQAANAPAEPAETTFAYFGGAPAEFCNNADVEIHVGTKRLPAHSQILASRSHFMTKMFQDLNISCSRSSKFVVPEETLAGFTSEQLEQFLERIYSASPYPIRTATQAYELYRLADLFDSPTVRTAASSYLEAKAGSFLQATCAEPGVLKWLLIAEEFGLAELRTACIAFTAKYYEVVKGDARLKLLPNSTLLGVISQLIWRNPARSGHHKPVKRAARQIDTNDDDDLPL